MENKRETLGSRLGFLLLSAGCAIGLGNVWTFPWRVGNNGGGAFVFCYVIALIVLGIPIMTAEFSVGRSVKVSPILTYQKMENSKGLWRFHGIIALLGNVFLMMFYTTIAGYFIYYFFRFVGGDFETLSYGATAANTSVNVIYMIVVVVLGFGVLSLGLQSGLEKVNKYMMVALFMLLFVLAVRACTMAGAAEGLKFYLTPDFSAINMQVIIKAMNQAFFSLSLGIGSMAIFSSYIGQERTLLGESVSVIALDTLVAIMAGFIIFPACFTFNINPDAGPPLLFTTMTAVFSNMTAGRVWGTLFFLFMTFAAMSTVFAVFENILAMVRDITGWSRKKGCLILCIVMIVLCLPMALSGSILSGFQPFSEGSGVLDLWDYFVETLLQPLGSLMYLVFCSRAFGWGWDNFVKEANAGKGLKVRAWMRPVFTWVSPLIIFALWVYGLVTFQYR